MEIRRKLPIVALVLVFASVGLSACAAGNEPSQETSHSAIAQPEESESQPQEEPEAGNESETSNGDKPSKADVAEGFLNIARQTLGEEFLEEQADEIAACFIDKAYDGLSSETLNAIADGKIWEMNQEEMPVYTSASALCGEELGF